MRPSRLLLAGLAVGLMTLPAPAEAGRRRGGDRDLARRVTQLEAEVVALKAQLARLAAGDDLAARQAREEAAMAAVEAAYAHIESGDTAAAVEAFEALVAEFGDTRIGPVAQRLLDELRVVGTPWLPLDGITWLTEAPAEPTGPTLLVFWEVWCPHCRRELPELAARRDELAALGLDVVTLTKVTRGVTEDEVRGFAAEHDLWFPVGRETGAHSEHYGVDGVPAAALVRDGAVVWRGHPAALERAVLAALLD